MGNNEQKILRKRTLIIAGMAAALVAALIFSFAVGRFPIAPGEVLGAIGERIISAVNRVFGAGISPPAVSEQTAAILWRIRMPRVILACLVGCCLSAAGAAYQGVFRNPMASPDILGASSGAAVGAALAILFGLGSAMIMVSAFAASLATIALVMLISRLARGSRILRIILSGIMVSSLCNAVTNFIKLVADPNNVLPEITYWMMGSLAKTRQTDLNFAFFPMLIGCVPLVLLRWRANLLTMPDEEARAMGVNTGGIRVAVIVCATLVTAASVSVSGLIGWVGLVVPHLARRLVGNDYRHLLPASMVTGALFMLIVDNISRNLMLTEIPIGILTAVVGAPFFIWLITRRSETS